MCKKILAMSAALVLTLSMAACGNAGTETTVPSGTTEPSSATQPSQSTPSTETTVPETTVATEPVASEIVLVDNEACTVKVTGFDPNGILGYGVKFFLENKIDESLMFSVKDVSVNGFMIDPFWASEVAGEKKANETITFLANDFKENGVETVSEITFTLTVYESDDVLSDNIVEETFTVKP